MMMTDDDQAGAGANTDNLQNGQDRCPYIFSIKSQHICYHSLPVTASHFAMLWQAYELLCRMRPCLSQGGLRLATVCMLSSGDN